MARVAFIGLGVMGYPMAGHLAAKGHAVTVYNRTASRAEAWVAQHGHARAATPAAAADGAEIVLPASATMPTCAASPSARTAPSRRWRRGGLCRPHHRLGGDRPRLAAAAAERGAGFVDAPVSGGQAGAENGALTVMCGGAEEAYARAEPVIMAYARACRRMGPVGAGQLTKMVNQILHRRAFAGPLRGPRLRRESRA